MSKQQLKELASTRKLTKTTTRLVSYSGNIIKVEGTIDFIGISPKESISVAILHR